MTNVTFVEEKAEPQKVLGRDLQKGRYYKHGDRIVVCTEWQRSGGAWADLATGDTGNSGSNCQWDEIRLTVVNYQVIS